MLRCICFASDLYAHLVSLLLPACLLFFLTILAWFVASFLPLPAKPDMDLDEPGPQIEFAHRIRLLDRLRRRYDNARWWRNVNRWMTLLGFAIIVIVVGSYAHFCAGHCSLTSVQITLAVVGSTTGFQSRRQ